MGGGDGGEWCMCEPGGWGGVKGGGPLGRWSWSGGGGGGALLGGRGGFMPGGVIGNAEGGLGPRIQFSPTVCGPPTVICGCREANDIP